MRRSRFTETPIVAILKEAEAGEKAREICRQHGIEDRPHHSVGRCKPLTRFRRAGEKARLSTFELSS